MWLKYLINSNNNIGFKYSPIKQTLVIGGHLAQYDDIDKLVESFERDKVKRSYPNHNKVKFTIKCTEATYKEFKDFLTLGSIGFTMVESHGRLFR